MQTIVERWKNIWFSSRCCFTIAAPLQPNLVAKALRPPPDLPLEIWLEIFQFATYIHSHETLRPLDPFTPRRITTNVMGANTPSLVMRTKLSIVLVSRAWRRIALQIFYRHIVIRSPARARAILHVLEQSRQPTSASSDSERSEIELDSPTTALPMGHGQWTRHIEVYTHMRGSADIRFLQNIFKIFQCCPNLQFLSGKWNHQLPVEFLEGISALYGTSLEGIFWADSMPQLDYNTVATPEFIGSFHSVRTLDLRQFHGADPVTRSSDAPRPTLPNVQELIVANSERSLVTASILHLPKLNNLTIRTNGGASGTNDHLIAFLKVHGHNLVSVDLPTPSDMDFDLDHAPVRRNAEFIPPDLFLQPDTCPNLETLVYSCLAPNAPTHSHPNLRRIGIRGMTADFLYPDKASVTKDHLSALTVQKYPRLEHVQMVGFLVESHGDSIMKDACIWWVEKFEKMGVLFLDGECVLWVYSEPEETQVEQMATTTKKQETEIQVKSIGVEKTEKKLEEAKLKEQRPLEPPVAVIPAI
ncbi:hypothetical protein CPB83DRAFT_856391 [Crepidotus variabilis]|uniref:F-box domain-containing protein n=1 Tax=Crepidotus variabilis TaxID=179855 RepID=A0A9P6JNF5_9AGAR|nr:hypothetical protein CPB83DRAFT_856391 [Crepidotus variabilis]